MIKLNSSNFILVDNEGRMLLQQRTYDAEIMPGYWAFFGGGVEKGETALDAVVREAKEELNFEMKKPHFVCKKNIKLNNAEGKLSVFIERFMNHKSELTLKEGRDWGWYLLEETKPLKMIEHDREILIEIKHYIENKLI